MCHTVASERKNSEFLTETKTNCVQMRKVHKRVVAGKSREEEKNDPTLARNDTRRENRTDQWNRLMVIMV